MLPRFQISAAGSLIVILIAALGFAAVGADSSADEIQPETSSVLPESLSARVAAASFSALLNPEIEQTAAPEVLTAVLPAATPKAEPVPTTTTTTTTAPTTTTMVPPATTTTTTTKPPATTTTTTTTAPPATTTTAPPASTTTMPETTTTTTTAPPVDGGSRDVEEWRSLVAQYFPENLVDEALLVIKCESNGDPLAYNPNSGASGLFQFIPNTWGWASVQAGFGGSSPFEPEANIGSAAWLVQTSLNQGKSAWTHWSCKP